MKNYVNIKQFKASAERLKGRLHWWLKLGFSPEIPAEQSYVAYIYRLELWL